MCKWQAPTIGLIFAFLTALVFPSASVFAQHGPGLKTTTLTIDLTEVVGIELSTYSVGLGVGETIDDLSLTVEGSTLTDGVRTTPLSTLKPLLRSLHTLYPGTRPLSYIHWTDDYPHHRAVIKLADGRQIEISSTSQYGHLVPWNIQIWQAETLTTSYVLLHDDLYAALAALWEPLTGQPYPRDYDAEEFWKFWDETPSETLQFNSSGYDDYASDAIVYGAPPDMMTPYVELLRANTELARLFDAGYTLFDAAFDITVTVQDIHPVKYEGMIALAAPDGPDVIVTTAAITLGPTLSTETPLTAERATALVVQRRQRSFLDTVPQVLVGALFLLDQTPPPLDCPAQPNVEAVDFAVETLLNREGGTHATFYHLRHQPAWTADINLRRADGNWDDTAVSAMLTNWFPPEFADVNPADLEALATNFGLVFQPNTTDLKPELIDVLKRNLPPEADLHIEHPQKTGDMTLATLTGRLIIPEDGGTPQVVYCDWTRPDWYGAPYDVQGVIVPDDNHRDLTLGKPITTTGWTPVRSLPNQTADVNWTAIGVSQPGFVHLLWTNDKGVYYADGFADGTGWTKAQRLGDDSWNMQIVTNRRGDMHLLWSTDPIGSMHVWREAGGEWHTPEYWEGIGYFSQTLLDETGRLHLGWTGSDSIDDEFFYARWTATDGLSEPENVSRRLGDIGNYDLRLRVDSAGTIHAVWGHPLSGESYIDSLSGEVFDQAGVFYSQRMDNGEWTLPEPIGTFAPFAYTLDMELTDADEPVVIWQAAEGLVTRQRRREQWETSLLLEAVTPPEEPDPFGPGRWGEATSEIQMGRDGQGQIYAAWVSSKGLFLAMFAEGVWTTPLFVSAGPIESLRLVVTPHGIAHLLMLKDYRLTYAQVAEEETELKTFNVNYDGYGLPVVDLVVDETGMVYILGLPRSPRWAVYIPETGIPPTSTPIPTPTLAPAPTSTTPPVNTPTPVVENTPPSLPVLDETPQSLGNVYVALAMASLFGLGWWIVRLRQRGKP